MPRPAYSGAAWRRVRSYVLWRDGGVCQVQLPGCTEIATEVDHLDPVALHGPCFDPDRLRAACKPCNNALGGQVAILKARIAEAAAFVGPSRDW